jgi:hypothetical protein
MDIAKRCYNITEHANVDRSKKRKGKRKEILFVHSENVYLAAV